MQEIMRSPSTIGSILILASLFALLSPLVSLGAHFLDLSSPWESMSMSMMMDVSVSSQPSSLKTAVPLDYAFSLMTMVAHAVRQLPRLVACGMTAYVGICAGYVGMVHLRLVRPDQKCS